MAVVVHTTRNAGSATRRYYRPVRVHAGLKSVGALLPVRLQRVYLDLKYNPTQPRVPRGNPAGGQWTDDMAFGGDGVPHRAANRKPPPLTNQELALVRRDGIMPVYPEAIIAARAIAQVTARAAVSTFGILSRELLTYHHNPAFRNAAKAIYDFLGGTAKVRRNGAGDIFIMRNNRMIRFDIKNPGRVRNGQPDKPHFHLKKILPSGKLQDAARTHRNYFKE